MYLRKFRRRKDGKAHWYWALVESVRVGAKVCQRVVAYLGDVADEEATGWEHLVRRLDGRPLCEPDLLERREVPAKPVEIFPDRVRDFGDAFVGLALWRYLGLDRFFAERMARGREAIAWATMVAYATVARFCEPASELATAESFTDRSALADLLGLDPLAINEDRLYRTLDHALKHKSALAAHLRGAYADLFGADYDLLLYDLTSTYFEGEAAGIPQARYGYSRDKRSDCKQVIIALVVTREGLPLDFEIFDGNRRDHQTLQQIVEAVEAKFGRAGRIWVMDRGLSTEDNLAWLRGRGGFYLVGTPKAMLRRFEQQLLDAPWKAVRDGLDVALLHAPDGSEELSVLCRSRDRIEKERAILTRFANRIEAGLGKIAKACCRRRAPLRDRLDLGKRLGALLKANSRASRLFDIRVEELARGRLQLSWTRKNPDGTSWAERTAGHYLLRAHLGGQLTPNQFWQAYIQLTRVEEAFRKFKSNLAVRPIFHKTQPRVHAHVFLSFLSLVMLQTFEQHLDNAGLGRSPQKVLAELRAGTPWTSSSPPPTAVNFAAASSPNPNPPSKPSSSAFAFDHPKPSQTGEM
ncbi:MAG: IS1634 family transposase [bacterium]